jgi:large subunit ribosomal protein L31e
MAEKKSIEPKIILEREYVVPLRKEWLKVPLYKRSKKAVTGLREFLAKHMKSEDVKIGGHLNDFIWKHGIKNPPHKVSLKAVKYDDGVVKAELEGKEFKEAVKIKPKVEKPTGLKGKLQDAVENVKGKDEETGNKESKETTEKLETKKDDGSVSKSETKTTKEPKADVKPKAESKSESKAESKPKGDSKPDSKKDSKAESKKQAESKPVEKNKE